MFCERCGNKAGENDTFCVKCGHTFEKNNHSATNKNTLSAENESAISSNDFSNISAENLYSNILYENKKKKPSIDFSNKALIITICACTAVLVILGVVMAILMSSDSSEDTANEPLQSVFWQETDNKETKKTINKINKEIVENIIKGKSNYTKHGVYVHNINNGYKFAYNGEHKFLSSAMGQVVILDTLSRAINEKNIDIDDARLRFDYLPNGKEAPHSKNQNGSILTVKECVEDVAIYGDNNKSNLLVDYIGSLYNEDNGFNVINSVLASNGYSKTEINRKTFIDSKYIDYSVSPNVTTPSEIGAMYYSLLYNSEFGSDTYMKNIFKSISNKGEAIGLKKFVPAYYDVYNVNALTSQCTNNVAFISNGETDLIVAILSQTQEDKTDIEDNTAREKIQEELIRYILKTQFED